MVVCPGDYIKELLIHHKSVSLPAIGGFLTQSRSAQLDEGLGKLSPPSKKLIFTPNLAIDDGLLVNFMMEKFNFSLQEATDVLMDYCQDIEHALNNKEFFSFRGIGRIYKDFEGKIKFLPDHSNLNADAFGLPDLDFSPMAQESTAIHQPRVIPEDTVDLEPSNVIPVASTPTAKGKAWLTGNAKLLVALLALILVVYVGYSSLKKDKNAEKTAVNAPEERTNIAPIRDMDATHALKEKEIPGSDEEPAIIDTEQPTIAPDQKVAIIAIGKFGNQENVKRLVKRIFDEGFDPYQEKLGKLTRVGVQFTYENDAEVNETLQQIRKIFEPDAEILKK